MFKNYLLVMFRNIRKHRGYSFINVAGLSIGMACCILILLWVRSEWSFDRFHENADRVYRIGNILTVGGSTRQNPSVSAPMGPMMVETYPEIVAAARISRRERTAVRYGETQIFEEKILYADSHIFDVFTFPLLRGNPKTALLTSHSAVITEKTAKKYFGDTDPIGRFLRFDGRDDFAVTGVVRNVPANSHLTFDILCSLETLYAENRPMMELWGRFGVFTYILLAKNADAAVLEKKLPDFIEKYMGTTLHRAGASVELFLQPLLRIHLHSNLQGELSGSGDILSVHIFSGIALFILLIACINFINLSTARSSIRAKEVGLRKTFGAYRKTLIGQFFGETIVHALLAGLLAVILVLVLLPEFRSLTGREFRFAQILNFSFISGLCGMIVFVGLVAGSYPALFLSSFRPTEVFRGNVRRGPLNSRPRAALIVFQFMISIVLIIGTMTMLRQIRYMKTKRLGFDKEHVLVVPHADQSTATDIRSIRSEIERLHGVVSASVSSGVPGGGGAMVNFLPEGFPEDDNQLMTVLYVDEYFLQSYGIKLKAGRNFSKVMGTDPLSSVMINETAMRQFNWADAVGKTVRQRISTPAGPRWGEKRIIGVIEDFHFQSLHQKIGPLFISNSPTDAVSGQSAFEMVSIRIAPENVVGTTNSIKRIWQEMAPKIPFDSFFLDVSFDSQYRSEERQGMIFSYFAVLAIFIACLGLFGIASSMVERRTKEIGIRKIAGATVSGITIMVERQFTKWVAMANIVAWPLAWYGMNKWLQNFAYRIRVGWWTFLLAGALAFVIASLTVSYQAVKAATANPVEAIRHE